MKFFSTNLKLFWMANQGHRATCQNLPLPGGLLVIGLVGPRFPGTRAVYLLRQVCDELQAAHAASLIHCDIKPSNLLVCSRDWTYDVVKVLDFGLVLNINPGDQAEKLTQEGDIAGTPAYMSPEQGAGQRQLDARSDLYSLGAVAYFLLTGQPPFVRGTDIHALVAHLQDLVVPLIDLCL